MATGNFNDSANWSATSGGTGGASVPGTGDTAIFDPWHGASDKPQNLTWTKKADAYMTFHWDLVPDATGYQIQPKTNTTWGNSVDVATTTFTREYNQNVGNGIRVRAVIPGGYTAWSELLFDGTNNTPNFDIPFVPSVLVPVQIGNMQINSGSNHLAIKIIPTCA